MSGPPEEPRLEEALRLTDTLDVPAAVTAAPPEHAAGGLAVLAEIGLAFRGPASERGADGRQAVLFRWGSLEVRRPLGQGSFGEVFAAWEPRLQREVALKLRRPEAGTLRWLDEARSLARVRHPNVVTVFGADLLDDRAGMWTELVNGETLEAMLAASGPLEPREALRIARDLASALDAVHRAHLVHGDLKASNAMLERVTEPAAGARENAAPPRRVVLMDFGAASSSAPHGEGPARFATPMYAAPELLAGSAPTFATDVYALGVLLYRLVSGHYPIEAGTMEEVRALHARGEHVPLARRRPGLGRDLVRVVERALAPAAADRYASASAMRDALARLLGERVLPIRALAVAVAVVVAVAAIAAAGWAFYLDRESHDTERYVAPPAPTLAIPRTPWWSSNPDSAGMGRGWGARLGPDLNGDGWMDAVVVDQSYLGAPGYFGRVMVYAGGPAGLSPHPVWTYLFPGHESTLQTCAAGDFNGDGRADLVITWHLDERPDGRMGGALMFAGTEQGLAHVPSWRMPGEKGYCALGEETVCPGDINGDGIDDLLIGEHDWSWARRNQGRVLVYFGSKQGLPAQPSQIITDVAQGDRFGHGICGVGDVNGDGFRDVAIGAPQWSGPDGQTGRIKLYFGGPRGLTPAPCPPITGERAGEWLGARQTLAGIGDVNGDGYADLAAGALGHDGMGMGVGQIRVYLGGPRGWEPRPVWRVDGLGSDATLGRNLVAGDVNGDGLIDLVAGAPGFGLSPASKHAGAVFVFLGAGPKRYFDKRPAWWTWSGQADAAFGEFFSVGDVDRDGCADILAQIPLWRHGSAVTGQELLFHGSRGTPPPPR